MLKKVLLLFATLVSFSNSQLCHVIAMSGGGSRAAYQAGAIYELIESLPAEDVTWDIVSGVSGGAMNAARMSSYSVGDELSMAEGLKVFWHEMATEDIWKMWEGGLVEGILNQSGVFNSTPAEETVTKMYSEMPPKRGMVVSSVDSKDGVYHSFTELTDFEDLPLVVMASGAAPGVFPPKYLDEMVLMDGGTVWNTNFEVPIKRCLELVDRQDQIVVDIAICQHAELSETYAGDSTIDNILRQHEIKSYYKTLEDLYEFSEANPEVNFRYVFVPSEAIPGGVHMLNFNGDHTDPFFQLGIDDAKKILAMEEGEGVKRLKQWQNDRVKNGQNDLFQTYLYA